MADFDDFRDRFRNDKDKAHTEEVRATQRQSLADRKQWDLWAELKNAADSAVKTVNSGDSVLVFSDSDTVSGSKDTFEIIYTRHEKRRTASANFKPDSNAVEVVIQNPDKKGNGRKVFSIEANNGNRLDLVLNGSPYTPKKVVELMLDGLL